MNKSVKRNPVFTNAEINHILWLIKDNERIGWYLGSQEQHWKRSERIKEKLRG
jgi:hypothetical protein